MLEAGGRVDLPLRELLLQAAARDLAQRLHHPRSTEQGKPTRKGERGRSVESGGDPTSRAAGSGGGGLGFLTFREGDEEEGEELVMARAPAGRPAAGFRRRRKGRRGEGKTGERKGICARVCGRRCSGGCCLVVGRQRSAKGEKKVEERSDQGRGDFRPNGPRPSAFLHVLGPGGLDFGC